MTQILLLPLMLYASCGLVLSLLVHLLSFFGIQLGGMPLFIGLHVGIFPLWLPVVLIMMRMAGGANRKDSWKIMLSGCPPWMRYMTRGFFIYAIANFAIFVVLMAAHPAPKSPSNGTPPPEVWRGFSGHWMVFYSVGLAVLTTAYSRGLGNLRRRCQFGHEIGWTDRFCPTCGAAIAPAPEPG